MHRTELDCTMFVLQLHKMKLEMIVKSTLKYN